jgi:hypothetical protein
MIDVSSLMNESCIKGMVLNVLGEQTSEYELRLYCSPDGRLTPLTLPNGMMVCDSVNRNGRPP